MKRRAIARTSRSTVVARLLGLSLFVIASVACVNTPIDQKLYDKYLSRSFKQSKARCFQATLRALKDINTPVESSDPATGMVYSEKAPYLRATQFSPSGPAGSVGVPVTMSHRMTLQIDGSEDTCNVRTVKYEIWRNNEKLEAINTEWIEKNVWRPFFVSVQDGLDRP